MIKKLILKLIPRTPLHKLPFWRDLEHREKIKKLSRELDLVRHKVYVDGQGYWLVDHREFKNLYRIAQEQQKLLQK